MSQQLVQHFLNDLDRLKKLSGSLNEQTVREAFKDLLKAWARQNNLLFVAELDYATGQKTKVYPDGTILHDLRVPLGYWEAKDTKDDLDDEIVKKFARGYPQDNIIFENTEEAVLIQHRQEAFRCKMADTENLLKLLNLFFGYERAEIAEFRKAVELFKADLPHVLEALREKINDAYADNAEFQTEATRFLAHVKETVNPHLAEADVREMLIQHILTEEIFAHVFNEGDFHRENNIARELYRLEGAFFTGAVKKETLKTLEPYYAAIRANAAQISNHQEKQTFLKLIYENFYKVYNPKAADRLGVVYTPNEIVRFMIEGADWLTQKHFGKALIDPHVEILDPATGTGTFICELIEYFRGQPDKLAHKYKNELHANEVAILPYYVANLNIEATYAAVTGQFAEFPNLCFVDTLDNVAALGIKSGHQHDLFGAMSDENIARVQRQNSKKISVVIGNPPYNANQQNENDNNKNREYRRVDELIKSSYIRRSTAQKTKVYDMYARFYRWASDRLHDDGVLAFITNRSFIDSRTFDGFRNCVADEFSDIYVVDLGGDVRANPKLSGTKNNVFGIQTGVAIAFMVKHKGAKDKKIHYVRRPEMDTAQDKLDWLAANPASRVKFERIEPDKNANWINLTENNWDELIPVASKAEKAGKKGAKDRAIFKQFGNGVNTARDHWVTDHSPVELGRKVELALRLYSRSLEIGSLDSRLKWSRNLKSKWTASKSEQFSQAHMRAYNYRPFLRLKAYLSPLLIDELGFMVQQDGSDNFHIAFPNGGNFRCLASDFPVDFHFIGDSRVISRYRYSKDGEKIDNITDWALKQFRAAYGKPLPSPLAGEGGSARSDETDEGAAAQGRATGLDPSFGPPHPSASLTPSPTRGEGRAGGKPGAISKDAIFHYVYGVLHDPVYRETYAINLKREFPRIPFYPDFWQWADWGERLMALHIGYETVEPWPLERIDEPDERAREAGVAPKAMLKSDHDNGTIRLDSETQLTGIPAEVWSYRLGNRSGLDWILDQYKEKTPRDPTIREKFNTYRFADYKDTVIDLLARVTRVSVETVAITEAMKGAKR
ncbi:MAG: type ISP restriction/modification enzyme [Hoeflea sp.]|uniref:type ISP restriction/modification enzyme n=1 Tax=Hoeflea sp. TaxID=1940281 RepID=UPI00329951FF